MRAPCLVALVSALAATVVAPSASGQSSKWTPPHMADGKPDLQGTYTFATITPLQRPSALAGKDVLSPEEAAEFEASENDRLNRDLFDPEKGQPSAGYPGRADGGVLSYNDFWYERGSQLTADRRTSLIVDPPDGRIPFSASTRARMAERAARTNAGVFDDPEDLSLVDRCILGFDLGSADDLGHVQQQSANRPGARLRHDLQRDGPQRANHPDRRSSTRHAPAVDGRLARPVGGRHARHRDAELQARDQPARIDRQHHSRGASHAE